MNLRFLTKCRFLFFVTAFFSLNVLEAGIFNILETNIRSPMPIFSMGGGYIHQNKTRHYDHALHGGFLQGEYKWGCYLWQRLRPQVSVIIPEFHSVYVGAGLGWELFLLKNILFTPSFEGGLFFRGRARDLGYPLEFRSTLDLAYVFCDNARIGLQAFHISNAGLGDHNPGMNFYSVYISIPVPCY